jgi:hypothetical protein
MISLEKLVQNISQCKDSKISLPAYNDNDTDKFVQKTAIEMRKMELEALDIDLDDINQANYTMDIELKELNVKLNEDLEVTKMKNDMQQIPSKSLIVYTENETAPLPESILEVFKQAKLDNSEWYIYGLKNPESFYKSFLLLSKLDFIIKNKTEKKNEVATFKREMALQYETFYNDLEYRKLRFHRYEMIHNLTSVDNYCEYDALKYVVDYNKLNLLVLDIINNKYLDIAYTENNLGPNTSINSETGNWYVVIKYVNGIYLPLMRSNGKHYVNSTFMDIVKGNYERELLDKFKEPSSSVTQNNITQKNITEPENHNTHDEVDNILDCNTVSIFFNNTVPINNEPIIKRNEEFSFAIEDMIDIEEQESEPMGIPVPAPTTRSIPITTIEPSKVTVQKEEPKDDVKLDAFADFMNKIPMKSVKSTTKSPKHTQTKANSQEQPDKSNITLESVLNTVLTNNVANSVNNPETQGSSGKEDLKPIGKYNLGELQHLAKVYKINTQKDGKACKMINKTKEELYNEIKEKQ